MIVSMRPWLAICVALLALAGPAAGQEIRPTLDKIKETGVVKGTIDERRSDAPCYRVMLFYDTRFGAWKPAAL